MYVFMCVIYELTRLLQYKKLLHIPVVWRFIFYLPRLSCLQNSHSSHNVFLSNDIHKLNFGNNKDS